MCEWNRTEALDTSQLMKMLSKYYAVNLGDHRIVLGILLFGGRSASASSVAIAPGYVLRDESTLTKAETCLLIAREGREMRRIRC